MLSNHRRLSSLLVLIGLSTLLVLFGSSIWTKSHRPSSGVRSRAGNSEGQTAVEQREGVVSTNAPLSSGTVLSGTVFRDGTPLTHADVPWKIRCSDGLLVEGYVRTDGEGRYSRKIMRRVDVGSTLLFTHDHCGHYLKRFDGDPSRVDVHFTSWRQRSQYFRVLDREARPLPNIGVGYFVEGFAVSHRTDADGRCGVLPADIEQASLEFHRCDPDHGVVLERISSHAAFTSGGDVELSGRAILLSIASEASATRLRVSVGEGPMRPLRYSGNPFPLLVDDAFSGSLRVSVEGPDGYALQTVEASESRVELTLEKSVVRPVEIIDRWNRPVSEIRVVRGDAKTFSLARKSKGKKEDYLGVSARRLLKSGSFEIRTDRAAVPTVGFWIISSVGAKRFEDESELGGTVALDDLCVFGRVAGQSGGRVDVVSEEYGTKTGYCSKNGEFCVPIVNDPNARWFLQVAASKTRIKATPGTYQIVPK